MRLDQVVKLLVFFGNADGRRGRDARRRGNSTQRSRTRCRRPSCADMSIGAVRADRHTRTTAHHLHGPGTRIQGRPGIYAQRAAGQSVPSRSANRRSSRPITARWVSKTRAFGEGGSTDAARPSRETSSFLWKR